MTTEYRRVEHFSPEAAAIARHPIRRRLARARVIEALSLMFIPVMTAFSSRYWHEDAVRSLLVAVRAAVLPLGLYLPLDRQLSECLRLLDGKTRSDVLHCRPIRSRRRLLALPSWRLQPTEPIDAFGFTPFCPTRRETLVADNEVEVLCGGRLGRTVIAVDHVRRVAVTGILDQPLHRIRVFMPDGTIRASRSAESSGAGNA